MDNPRRPHSLFWPIMLVGAGILLLLRNLELIPVFNLTMLLRLWPLLLVVLGVDLIFARRSPWVGTVIGLVTLAIVVVFLVASPQLGIPSAEAPQTVVFSSPLKDTTSVNYKISTAADPVTLNALAGSDELIHATITNRGTMKFDVSGEAEKTVTLYEESSADAGLVWDLLENNQKWDISLSKVLPVNLDLDGGSGSLNVNLEGIDLRSMRASFGSGSSRISLPHNATPYDVTIATGSGSMNMDVPGSSNLNLTLSSGSGSINIDVADLTSLTLTLSSASGSVHVNVPDGAALRIEVMDSGSGSLSVPGGLPRIEGNSDDHTGTWQSADYETATVKILIKVASRGSGSISIN